MEQLDFDGGRHPIVPARTLLDMCLDYQTRFDVSSPGEQRYEDALDFFAKLNLRTRQRRERTIQLRVLKRAGRDYLFALLARGTE